ncbi:hypothetical protein B0H13DRAFT_2677012 [Mycena leptocephala]|nr:hypothetical protein B0H13DRAFT_2677012 [Mycena leptocephala]
MHILILSLVLSTLCAALLQKESNALDDCQPQDRNGSVLQETAVQDAIGLSCQYPEAGQCIYYTNNGSLRTGSVICPQTIQGFGRIIPDGSDALDDCQPEDLQGTALKQNGLVDGGFGCQYPAAGPCHYYTSNGSLIVGGSILCPLSLKHTFILAASTSPFAMNTGTASATSSQFSQTISTPQDSGLPGPINQRHRTPPGTIAGIVVGVAILLISGTIVLCWRIRRARRAALLAEKETILPFITQYGGRSTLGTDSSARSVSKSSNGITRQHLQTQLLTATEKVTDLEHRTVQGGAAGGSSVYRIWRRMSASGKSPPNPDLEAELHTAREQINMIVARMNALEAHTDYLGCATSALSATPTSAAVGCPLLCSAAPFHATPLPPRCLPVHLAHVFRGPRPRCPAPAPSTLDPSPGPCLSRSASLLCPPSRHARPVIPRRCVPSPHETALCLPPVRCHAFRCVSSAHPSRPSPPLCPRPARLHCLTRPAASSPRACLSWHTRAAPCPALPFPSRLHTAVSLPAATLVYPVLASLRMSHPPPRCRRPVSPHTPPPTSTTTLLLARVRGSQLCLHVPVSPPSHSIRAPPPHPYLRPLHCPSCLRIPTPVSLRVHTAPPHLPPCPADRRVDTHPPSASGHGDTLKYPLRTALARVASRRTRDASIDTDSRERGRIQSPSQSRSASLPHFLSLPASTPLLPSPLLRPVNIDPARCSACAARVHSRAAFLGGTSLHPSPPPSSLLAHAKPFSPYSLLARRRQVACDDAEAVSIFLHHLPEFASTGAALCTRSAIISPPRTVPIPRYLH